MKVCFEIGLRSDSRVNDGHVDVTLHNINGNKSAS